MSLTAGKRCICRQALTALLLFAGAPVAAADPPFSDQSLSLTPRNQEVAEFVRAFFSAAGLNAVADSSVTGRINGSFSGPPAEIWAKVSQAFNLIAYYDGSIVTVYGANRVQSRVIPVPSGRASDVVSGTSRNGLTDRNNQLRSTSSDSITATGVPRFLDQVQQLAGALPNKARRTAEIAPPGATQPMRRYYEDEIEPYELRVFYLRYARADDTTLNAGGREVRVPGVGTILNQIMGDGSPVAGSIAASYGSRTIRQSQPRLGGRGLGRIAPDASQMSPYGNDYLGVMPADPTHIAAPAESKGRYLQSGPRIAIDPSLNAVIVRDRPENMPAYEGLVRALDVRPQIVELEATIIDLNVDRLRELGINWRLSFDDFGALFGGDILRRTGNPAREVAVTGSRNRGLSLSGVIGANDEFIARIQALEEKGAARIVSRPQIVTLSNIEAVFDRTRTFYVRVAGDEQVDLFNVTAGTVLRVNPHVLSDDGVLRIRMVVSVEDGTVLDAEVDDIPVVERASVNTQALINEGEALLLGGLTVNADFDAESKVPLLGDIPIIGELFKSRSRSRQRTERLFLITPRIVRLAPAVAATDVSPATSTPRAEGGL